MPEERKPAVDLAGESWLWGGEETTTASPDGDEGMPSPEGVVAAPLPPWEQPGPAEAPHHTPSGGGGSAVPPDIPGTGGPGGPGSPAGGRPMPAPLPPRAQPRDNGLGALGIGLGSVGLLLGLFFPLALLLTVILGLLAVVCGAIALRRCVDTGAPGQNRAIAALVIGILTFVALGMSLTLWGKEVQETHEQTRGIFGDLNDAMDDMTRSMEISRLDLPGRGLATLTLDGHVFEIPLDGCGWNEPVPGYRLVGRGELRGARDVELYIASITLGVKGEAVSVELGAQTYLLQAEELFVVDGNTVRASGTFRVPMSQNEAVGQLEATCSA